MTINPSQGYGKYQSIVNSIKKSNSGNAASAKALPEGLAKSEAKTDTISLSGDAAARAELSRISGAVSAEVEGLGNADRLASLAEKVRSGEYFVSSGDLADAILDRNV